MEGGPDLTMDPAASPGEGREEGLGREGAATDGFGREGGRGRGGCGMGGDGSWWGGSGTKSWMDGNERNLIVGK